MKTVIYGRGWTPWTVLNLPRELLEDLRTGKVIAFPNFWRVPLRDMAVYDPDLPVQLLSESKAPIRLRMMKITVGAGTQIELVCAIDEEVRGGYPGVPASVLLDGQLQSCSLDILEYTILIESRLAKAEAVLNHLLNCWPEEHAQLDKKRARSAN
jgi:hypothetical protein